jgi:Tfp pilus assembly protein PilF
MAGPRRRPAPRHASRGRYHWVFPLIVVSLTLVTFWPALSSDFVNWDDPDNLTENPFYRGLGWSELRWMWTTTLMGVYIPLTWMTFGLDYLVWGTNPVGYHLTSLLLHTANAGLVYLMARRLLSLSLDDPPAPDLRVRLGAAFAALLFGVHPLRVESVAWATERRDVLCALFFLASILAYLRHARSEEAGRWHRWCWISLGLFIAAVLSKAIAVTLPAVLVVLDVYPLRRLGARPRSWLESTGPRVLSEKIPFVLVSAAGSVVAVLANRGNLSSLGELGVLERVAVCVYSLGFYLWKTIAPVHLAPLYELRTPVDLTAWPFLLSAAVVMAITLFAVLGRHRWPGVGTAWVCSLIMFAPVLGIAQNGPQVAADRYTYLPTLPWAVLAGGALARVARATGLTRQVVARLALPVTAIAGLAVLASVHTLTWRSSERLWTHALAVAPSSIAHYNLGVVLDGQGLWDQAVEHYRQALAIKPDFAEAHYNWGVVLSRQGHADAALEHYREAVRIKPDHAEAHYNWGLLAAAQGQDDEAIDHYAAALRSQPGFAAAHNNWGNALVRRGQWAGAIEHYQAALRLRPDYAEAHNNLASVLARQERWDEAIDHYQRALEIKPDFVAARDNLERILSATRGAGPRDRDLASPRGRPGS